MLKITDRVSSSQRSSNGMRLFLKMDRSCRTIRAENYFLCKPDHRSYPGTAEPFRIAPAKPVAYKCLVTFGYQAVAYLDTDSHRADEMPSRAL